MKYFRYINRGKVDMLLVYGKNTGEARMYAGKYTNDVFQMKPKKH